MTPAWLDTQAYPFTPHYLNLQGTNMHYIDEGQGPVIVFVHGTPSWSYEFREVIRQLSAKYRCIAPDHIGFGLADKPADYNYTLEQHTSNLRALIDHLHLDKFTMAVHDFGGPIGLAAAASIPERIDRLIISNTWCFSIANEPEFKKMKAILGSPLLPFLYRYLNFSAKYIVPAAFGERSRLTPAIHQHYMKPFGKASERNGTIAFAKSLLKDQDRFAQVGEQIRSLRDKPALLIWGMKDTLITEKYLLKMEQLFPNAKTVRYADAGHFVFEEKGSVASVEILRFLS